LIDELTELRRQLDGTSSAQFEEIKKIITQVTEIDKRHIKFMKGLQKDVRASYKEIKQGQRINAGYNPWPGNEISSTSDMKQ
jgi:hypothetical protein